MKWKTTVFLLVTTVGVGAFISLYEIRRPGTEERERRSRQLLSFPAASVSQIEVQTANGTVSLTRDGARWRLGPQRVRANEELIGQLLNETSFLAAQRIFSESAEKPLDLKAFGLDPSVARITLTAEGGAATLLIGEQTPVHTNRYAKRSDQSDVAVISPTLFNTMNQPADAFRDPLLIRFDTWMADAITITTPNRTLSLSRSGTDWQLTQPLTDRVDRPAVTNLLNSLSALRITRVVEDAPQVEQLAAWGFDAPAAEVILRLQGQSASTTTVFFGRPLPEDNTLLYAKRSDEPTLYAVPAAAVDGVLPEPNSLRAKACMEFFTSEVTKIEVLQGTRGWTIERKDDTVEAFLNTLADLRLLEFVDEHPQDLARYGLAPPEGTISVWTQNPDQPQRLLVGMTIEGSTNRYGRIEGREPVVSLPNTVTELLSTPLSVLE